MLTKKQKEQIVNDLTEKVSQAKSLVFVEFTGTNSGEMNEIRRELRKNSAEMKVAKKTLVSLALKNNKYEVDLDKFKTQMAVAFGLNDEVSTAKILDKFGKKIKTLKILSGIVGKDFYNGPAMAALAKLPTREELLAKLVGTLNAPVSGFVNVLQGNIRGLVQVLSKINK
jgi:large subunit ribosomal protein L10